MIKKTITSLCCTVLLVFQGQAVEYTDLASFVPADADTFVQTSRLDAFLNRFIPFATDYYTGSGVDTIAGPLERYYKAAHINPVSRFSYLEAGIDTRRPVAYARFEEYGRASGYLAFIPVLDTVLASLRWGKIINRIRLMDNRDPVVPAQIPFQDKIIMYADSYYYIVINDYLVISNLLPLLQESVQLTRNSRSSLAVQPVFGLMEEQTTDDTILTVYARQGLSRVYGEQPRYHYYTLGIEENRLFYRHRELLDEHEEERSEHDEASASDIPVLMEKYGITSAWITRFASHASRGLVEVGAVSQWRDLTFTLEMNSAGEQ